jgi:putative SOS response-associated peptidase YedK
MCGRYSNHAEFSEIRLELKVEREALFREFRPTYNISPSHGPGYEQLIVVQGKDGVRELRLARWWLIPGFWKKAFKELPTAFNARAEDLSSKPFWKSAFQQRRCLVPATGWREFHGPAKKKQPYHFHLHGEVFAFAGLWSTWYGPNHEKIDSFAIVTVPATANAATIHPRMPLVVPKTHYDSWLDAGAEPARALELICTAATTLPVELYPSNPVANRSGFEGVEAIERVPDPPSTPHD